MTIPKKQLVEYSETPGSVYCPMCTHTVDAVTVTSRKSAKVKPGQRCARCHASLDAGVVIHYPKAA
jgi:uncharacterized Zn finger protein (UPF0148 family)